ncbi:MAG: hypothetical protein HOP18_13090 [Deltaproteobacteria bacterium]|nr:hypothetical protein [Deltaproteobacteria bacterium]
MRATILLLLYYACVIYTFTNPLFGVLFFVHITILRPESLVWGNLVFGRLHFITSLGVLIAYFIKRRSFSNIPLSDYQKNNLFLFFLLIVWLIIVSFLAEESKELSFNKTADLFKIFVLCFLFSKLINTKRGFEAYIWTVSISFALLGFWGVMQGILGNTRLDNLWPGGSNYIAAQLALIAPFTLAKTFDPLVSLKRKFSFFTCFFWIALCCIYTNSRGGFLGLGVSLIAFIFRVKYRVTISAVMLVFALVASPFVPVSYYDRFTSIFAEQTEQDVSAASRPVLWRIALRIWEDHPIAGVGLRNFSPVKERYINKVDDIVTSEEMSELIFNQPRFPHGLYPGMIAETGLVGLSLFLILLFRNIFSQFPAAFAQSQSGLYLQMRGAQAGLIGFAVAAVFGDFQYIELVYLQLFFVSSVRGYIDSLASDDSMDNCNKMLSVYSQRRMSVNKA